MVTLPLPLIVSLILGFLAIRHLLTGDRSALYLSLLGACAAQSLIISLAQHYGVVALAPVQPVTATLAPALAWLTFQAASLRPPGWARDWIHAAGPAFMAFAVAFAPETIDAALPLLFLAYGGAILLVLRRQEALARVKLAAGPVPGRLWTAIAVMLVLSAISDILISLAFGLGYGAWRPIIISVFTSVTLLGIGLLSLSPDAEADRAPEDSSKDPQDEKGRDPGAEKGDEPGREEEIALIARLDAHMAAARPFLDPDLTLARLARQLHVPIKRLSAAINRQKGENVSRYVNRFRVEAASAQLRAGSNVTEAMLASGFNTKSNFNREFIRITHQTPSEFAASLET